MKENLHSSEREKKGTPIHLIFGSHGDNNVLKLKHLDRAIEDKLAESGQKNVAVFVESVDFSEAIADLVENSVKEGISPSMSMRKGIFFALYNRTPRLLSLADFVRMFLIKKNVEEMKFNASHLSIIDKHFNQSGRIRLLLERQIVNSEDDLIIEEIYKTGLRLSYNAVNKGKFDSGLLAFKFAIDNFAAFQRGRNNKIVNVIARAEEDNSIGGIVGYLGSAHSSLRCKLSKLGYDVAGEFPDKENGKYIFEPCLIALRYREIFFDREADELGWYKIMLSHFIEESVRLGTIPKGLLTKECPSDQNIIERSRQVFRKLKLNDMKSIREFESDMRQRGTILALRDRLDGNE